MSLLLRMVVSFTFKGVLVFFLLYFGRRLCALLLVFLVCLLKRIEAWGPGEFCVIEILCCLDPLALGVQRSLCMDLEI